MPPPDLEHADNGGAGTSPKTSQVTVRHPPTQPMKGDIFRTLELPDSFIIGIDTLAMTTSKSLPGFRDIPPGAHFLWVQQPGGVSRCGYWFITGVQGSVRVKEWDGYNEVLRDPTNQPGAADQGKSTKSIYSTLQPYALHDRMETRSLSLGSLLPDWAQSPAGLWNVLTSAISSETLARITGQQDVNEYLLDSTDCAKDISKPNDQVEATSNKLNFIFTQDLRDLQVLDLGSMKARVVDTSARVEALLAHPDNNNNNNSNNKPPTKQDILAELQFTFLTGTHLSNSACLDQWWNLILKIVLRAHRLALTRPQLCRELLHTLFAQLLYTEHYFGSSSASPSDNGGRTATKDGPSSDRPIFQYKPQYREKLRLLLVEYKRQLSNLLQGLGSSITPEQAAVGRAFEELEAWLWRCGWDLRGGSTGSRDGKDNKVDDVPDSDEEEDEQPVVVELDEEGREVGLVSFRD